MSTTGTHAPSAEFKIFYNMLQMRAALQGLTPSAINLKVTKNPATAELYIHVTYDSAVANAVVPAESDTSLLVNGIIDNLKAQVDYSGVGIVTAAEVALKALGDRKASMEELKKMAGSKTPVKPGTIMFKGTRGVLSTSDIESTEKIWEALNIQEGAMSNMATKLEGESTLALNMLNGNNPEEAKYWAEELKYWRPKLRSDDKDEKSRAERAVKICITAMRSRLTNG